MSDRVLDISQFQPEDIDWTKIKKAGYKVIPRMGFRGSLQSNPAKYKKICHLLVLGKAFPRGRYDHVSSGGIFFYDFFDFLELGSVCRRCSAKF